MFVNKLLMSFSKHVIVCQHAVLRELANRIVSVIIITAYQILEAIIALLKMAYYTRHDICIRVAAHTRSSKMYILANVIVFCYIIIISRYSKVNLSLWCNILQRAPCQIRYPLGIFNTNKGWYLHHTYDAVQHVRLSVSKFLC